MLSVIASAMGLHCESAASIVTSFFRREVRLTYTLRAAIQVYHHLLLLVVIRLDRHLCFLTYGGLRGARGCRARNLQILIRPACVIVRFRHLALREVPPR